MKKNCLLISLLCLINIAVSAQVEVAKLIGKNSGDNKLGFGAFLKFSYPVSEAADMSLETGVLFFSAKSGDGSGTAFVPVKLGYRYTLNGTGTGFYAEPQLGYNVYGIRSYDADGYNVDEKFNGVIVAAGFGYLFPSWAGVNFDLGLRYESIIYKGRSVNFVGLRLSHNFSFKRRDSE